MNQPPDEVAMWSAIWKLNGPPKLRHFLWRAINGAIALKDNLYKRHIANEATCPICHEQPEDDIHALFDCPNVNRVWFRSSLMGILFEAPSASFKNRVNWCRDKLSKEDFVKFATIAWACWKVRNDYVFNDATPNTEAVVAGFLRLVSDFQSQVVRCNLPRVVQSMVSFSVWAPPPPGTIKINTDAGFLGDGWAGLGMVARDHLGKAIVAGVKRVRTSSDAETAEALAGKWGVQVAARFGCQQVLLESDALNLTMQLQAKKPNLAPVGLILEDILDICNNFRSFNVSHVKRGGNTVAHCVARLLPSNGVEELFVNTFPQSIQTLVGLDADA